MMRNLFAVAFCALALSALAGAGAFTVEEQDGDFRVLHRGKVLLDSVKAVALADGGLGLEPKASSAVLKDGTRVWNRWSEARETRIRLEVAVKGDGSEVEITMIGECEAYAKEQRRLVEIRLPWKAVEGCAYEGLLGNGRAWRPQKGTLDGKAKDDVKIGGALWRYLCFQGGAGAASGVVFDFNPLGAGDYMSSYAGGAIRGVFSFVREGEHARMRGGLVLSERPGITGGKLVLREGAFASDYPAHHAWRDFGYLHRLACQRLFSFGAVKHGKMYQAADHSAFDAARGFGWVDAPALRTVQAAPEGALYSAVAGKDAVFRMSGVTPGMHIVTVQCGNYGGAPNSFAIAVNGREALARQSVAKGELLALAMPVWATQGTIEVRFTGDFLVSAIGTGFLMAQAEDFTYQRGYWVSDGFEPGTIFRNCEARPDAVLAVSVERMPMPTPGGEEAEPLKPLVHYHLEMPPRPAAVAWIKKAVVGRFNNLADTMAEYADPAIMNRRLDELQRDGVNTLRTGGMHSRHTYPDHLDRGLEVLARVTAAAHARGMKVIEQHEATLLWQENIGFRVMAERLGETTRALPDMMPGPAFCVMNPVFARTYRDYLLELLRRTGVDGLQCDEVYFFPYFCGCSHCRAAFHADTGWWLPMNELDARLMNRDTRLWKTYLDWRKTKLAQWWVDFWPEATKINPDLVKSGYTTHFGFSTTRGALEKGGDLIEAAGAGCWFGTEIMPRNCLVNERPLVPYRKMYNLLRDMTRLPLWGLIYGSNHDAKYFAWAACNLCAQRGFTFYEAGPGRANFVAFGANPDNMDIAQARPTAEVMLFFSQAGRDWNKEVSMSHELMGIAQTLEELHIPYRIVTERTLTEENLKPCKVLVAGAAGCMSEETVARLVAFARRGGTVYLTGNAGRADELGFPRKQWPFEQWFGFTVQERRRSILVKLGTAQDPAQAIAPRTPLSVWRLAGKGSRPRQTALYGFGTTGKLFPLVFTAKCGKGRLIYQACTLGLPLFCEEDNVGRKFRFELDEGVARLYRGFLTDLLKDATPWQVSAPLKVHTELYRQGDAYVAHFLNGQGATLKKGDPVQYDPPGDPWPPIAGDITFTLAAPKASEAYAVSPDFAGRKPLKLTRSGANVTVTLPKALLKAYTVVWVR